MTLRTGCKLLLFGLAVATLAGCSSALRAKRTSELWEESDELMVDGRYEEAVPYYDELIYRDEESYRATALRGVAQESSERPTEALADYRRAIELQPENPLARLYRANMLLKSGNIEAAEEDVSFILERDAELEPHDRLAVLVLAGTLEQDRGQVGRALEYYGRAREVGRSDADLWTVKHYRDALYNSANIYRDMGAFDVAQERYQEYVEVKRRLGRELDSEDNYNLGELCYLRGDFRGARRYLEAASDDDRRRFVEATGDQSFFQGEIAPAEDYH